MASAKARKVNSIIAHLPGVKRAVHMEGRKIQARAESLFAQHNRPGGHEITGEPVKADVPGAMGQIDYLISLEGPAPLSVEYGRGSYTTKDGQKVGAMEGLRILGRAVQ